MGLMEVDTEIGQEVGEALATSLAARLDDLAGPEDLDVLNGRELAGRLQDLERLARRVEHAIVTVVSEADRRGVWAADGHRSVRGWCQATVNWSPAETTHRVRTVTLLADLDAVGDSLAAGEWAWRRCASWPGRGRTHVAVTSSATVPTPCWTTPWC